ncbi:hypothetical protein BI364_10365 [Acidihalobacter yilgarnensis]|uniref:Type IV secretion system coupling protein TraD DNA-binding domain-containing protein n=1 Tax=Acidihalobacter yilgarnensis TaxID=2819280 RepID=A0A1D8IP75_9GAMM|nr:type IV secretion system DNA-binding domain-containing protein [Acidihalobacter yilgarnensis]AOU98310.1 hypothetical protein BI364_10365 [Acidihalobacter yilgarnensis]
MPRDWLSTAGIAVGVGLPLSALGAAAALSIGVAGHQLPPLSTLARAIAGAHLPSLLSDALRLPNPIYSQVWLARFAPTWPAWATVGAAAGITAGIALGWLAGSVAEIKAERGRSVARGHAAARAEAAIETKVSGPGIQIHPQLQISRDRETRGIQLTGSPGSGKTVIIVWLLQQILRDPGARVLIHDIKGDFTSRIFSILREDERVSLVAPWDRRSARWSAAADIRSAADARELATRLIATPTTGNAQWAQGAQLILAGLVVTLAKGTKGRWTWADLQDEIAQPYSQMRASAITGAPMAAGLLPAEPNATTASYMANLTAAAGGLISDLAAADRATRGSWNARSWLAGRGPRIVILQGSTRFSELSKAVNSSIIRAISGNLDSMPDSRTRRIWLVMDELAQLGKVELSPLIETGRSKGVCLISGWQDVGQRRAIYGRDVADSWDSMIGTHLICRLIGPDSQQWASALVGRRQVRRQVRSASGDPTALSSRNMSRARNVSISEQIADEDVVRPEEFAALGPRAGGVEAMLITGGQTVHRMVWPFPQNWREVAPAHVPAAWTQGLATESDDSAEEKSPQTLLRPWL